MRSLVQLGLHIGQQFLPPLLGFFLSCSPPPPGSCLFFCFQLLVFRVRAFFGPGCSWPSPVAAVPACFPCAPPDPLSLPLCPFGWFRARGPWAWWRLCRALPPPPPRAAGRKLGATLELSSQDTHAV